MKYFLSMFFLILFITLIAVYFIKLDTKPNNSISAYYNTNGAFAGFIQKKKRID